MVRRLTVAVAAAALFLGLIAPTTASATPDPDYGWDYQSLSISGSYTMLKGQFAGDGATDVLFYGAGSAPDSLWIGKSGTQGANGFTKVNLTINGTYVPVVGDFGGDDYDDILFYGRGTNGDSLWTSADVAGYFTTKSLSIGGTYLPKVLHDYRGVGAKDDVLFLGPGSAPDYLWHFTDQVGTSGYDGPGTYASKSLKVNGAYQLVVGDFSGDLLDDVVLYQPGTAADYKWVSNAAGAFAQTNLTVNGTYQPVTVRHEQYDGIYWWASGSPNEAYWTSNGTSFTARTVGQYPGLTGTASEFGGYGVLVQSDAERDGYVYADETSADSYYLANESHDFGVATQFATGDFDRDGNFDVLWYGPGSRPDQVWYGLPANNKAADHAPSAERTTPFAER
ncbi:hypothetical protein KSP35_18840 [Aquihabitans sp. G128]|uniref:hypothetical protein n=1 Tax=Aquihabitans sp. G128 TaxID=2849779 RepID=UPI001C240BFD|nr:hypothetical protein [Aquihabitans sp. G128]QXC60366.1 hypothetical protein KSP35_18840 [Aquihabitans sp. G128]